MAKKENKGGSLTNEQVEKDLKVKGSSNEENWFHGSQDNGDQTIRNLGTQVQRNDGLSEEELNNDNHEPNDR